MRLQARTAMSILAFYIPQICGAAPSTGRDREPSRPVEILKMENRQSADDGDRAYEIFKVRFHKWIENNAPVSARVESAIPSEKLSTYLLEARALQLAEAARRLWSKLHAGADADAEYRALKMQLAKLEPASLLGQGPVLQNSFLAMGAYAWKNREKGEAEKWMRRGILVHPTFRIESVDLWPNEEPGFSFLPFEAELNRLSRMGARSCLAEIKIPPEAAVTINGFSVARSKNYALAVGEPYRIKISRAGYDDRELDLDCQRPGRTVAEVKLNERRVSATDLAVSNVDKPGIVPSSAFLIEPGKDDIRIYLFTPGVGIDEIPLRKPIRIAEVLRNPRDREIPVLSDAFVDVVQKHEARVAENFAGGRDGMASTSLEISRKPSWYEDWRVWAIAGGLAGGAVLAILMASSKNNVTSRPAGVGIRID